VQQIDRQGIGHAIQITREVVKDDEVIVVLGDTICEYDVKSVVESDCSMLGVRKVDDPREFGVAEIDDKGFIDHVVEKPHIPKSNMALVGIYKIKESEQLFQCLESNYLQGLRTHGEYSLTDALDCMLKQGVKFKPFKVDSWFDCGRKDTLLESNATLLKKFEGQAEVNYQFENTVIIPPVSIGEGCDIKNSIIGPDVTIGENTRINYSIIRNSIIGSFSNLFDIVLEASIIGSDTGLKGETRTLSIGDNTNIDLG
jgi:glucose-1-phosphate thymidylyltransferase